MEGLLYSFLAGSSTAIGALVLLFTGEPGKRTLSSLLGFAGGIMLGISVFELMPEAARFGSTVIAVVGFLLGAGMMHGMDRVLPHAHLSRSDHLVVENPRKLGGGTKETPLLRTGYLILFGIAMHNLPEGLAIGAGLEAGPELGFVIAVAIGFHNVPEGLAIAGPLRAGGLSMGKVILFTLLAGLMTPIGALIGLLILQISPVMVGGSMAFAAGAMVYIVNDELIPQANGMNSHLANAGLVAGLLLAFILL
jgi:ZIP family zinc transporter